MAAKEKLVEAITAMDQDFTQWYTDVVLKSELIDYSSVKGCMILRPYGYAIWENIQKNLDNMFKETGHENVAMPMFIPESLLQKEKDHVEGFAPEVAWVTHGGSEKLAERLCIRPTSETLFCDHYSQIIQSWRDLPKLYNQWVSVVRWEKTTRPFLRSTEFYWQEGHTAHATAEEAVEETIRMLNVYADFYRDYLAIPVIKGQKTEKEKFAGAVDTYTVEAMMHDGKALQSATSHYFGDGFARAFEIQYSDKNNKLQYVHQTSWGLSTRSIGAIIMVHGDDNGLVLPPRIAPIQVVIVPIAAHKAGVLDKANELKSELSSSFRVKLDDSDKMPGWKFAEYEMKGVPLRLEIGPRDLEQNQCVAVRRDTGEKTVLKLENLEAEVQRVLDEIHDTLYQRALSSLNSRIYEASDWETMSRMIAEKPGFVRAMWCGDLECELKIKDDLGATSRCMPLEQNSVSSTCVCCGKPATKEVIWGKAY
ncbi:MAG: proline--tRNA ligase [Eubacteriales bacterium]|nr:proline--tRNA ligase [Eubacteriales bacterium]MDD3197012.1 proline--tRNA ligase [Eubacteriales bacterium]MDD3503546.1 proline--tRNA ligase [Eubacteriales bacterium]MDD4681787.1 proline--tRNA ligase [Eubacteriales bacterium]